MSEPPKKVVIYCHGVHDFCPEGHDRRFMQAKYSFPNVHLVVGLISDQEIQANNSNLELLYSQLERYESLLHSRHVDEVVNDVPWTLDQKFIDKHKVDYVVTSDQHTERFFLDESTGEGENHKSSALFFGSLKKAGQFMELKPISLDKLDDTFDSKLAGKIACFNDDPVSSALRDKCAYDFDNRLNLEAAKSSSPERPVRVYADGIYDMFHPGHARQLKQAKQAFSHVHLMVGVVNDQITHHLKGPTVVPEAWRYDRVRHCKYADEVVRNAPWVLNDDFLIRNKIDFVAHDDIPYKSQDQEDVYKHVKELNMFLTTQRMVGISTTDLKARLKFNS